VRRRRRVLGARLRRCGSNDDHQRRRAVAWPPFYARGNLRAGTGADAAKLGSSRRRDGRRIVTYNGHPLYYYVTDRKPGQVTCHDVVEFGGTWLVVNPAGNAVS
jgi:predicted lipoprotein with Yx(FWY)xxD motif